MNDHLEEFLGQGRPGNPGTGLKQRAPGHRGHGRHAPELEDAVASEIIARLFLVHKVPADAEEPVFGSFLGDPFVPPLNNIERNRFLCLVLKGDIECSHMLLDELLARGLSNRQLLCDLLSGTAEELGELWEEDRADFAEVTMGLCHLHRVLRERGWSDDSSTETQAPGPSMLMTTFGGEQHIFGAMIAAELFAKAGWNVTTMVGAPHDEVRRHLADNAIDVLGISATHLHDEENARSEIAAFRAASRNPSLKVIVGGQAFLRQSDLFTRVGADAMAEDAEAAPCCHPG
jgi:methanogenic corrinoid protein MtbC1